MLEKLCPIPSIYTLTGRYSGSYIDLSYSGTGWYSWLEQQWDPEHNVRLEGYFWLSIRCFGHMLRIPESYLKPVHGFNHKQKG